MLEGIPRSDSGYQYEPLDSPRSPAYPKEDRSPATPLAKVHVPVHPICGDDDPDVEYGPKSVYMDDPFFTEEEARIEPTSATLEETQVDAETWAMLRSLRRKKADVLRELRESASEQSMSPEPRRRLEAPLATLAWSTFFLWQTRAWPPWHVPKEGDHPNPDATIYQTTQHRIGLYVRHSPVFG